MKKTKLDDQQFNDFVVKQYPRVWASLNRHIGDFDVHYRWDTQQNIFLGLVTAYRKKRLRLEYGERSAIRYIKQITKGECADLISWAAKERDCRVWNVKEKESALTTALRQLTSDDDHHIDDWFENLSPIQCLPGGKISIYMESFEDQYELKVIRQEVEKTPYAKILKLFYGDGMTRKEIAADLKLSEGQVRGSIQRGKAATKEIMKKLGYYPCRLLVF